MSKRTLIAACVIFGVLAITFGAAGLLAQETAPAAAPEPAEPSFHPLFPLLDANGVSVLTSGEPASTLKTCGECHDTTFIAGHSPHAEYSRLTFSDLIPIADPANMPTVASEMNCFLCHTTNPDNAARIAQLEAGDSLWANSATLLNSGVITRGEDGSWTWNADAFDAEGNVLASVLSPHEPQPENCGACHGLVQTDPLVPVGLTSLDASLRNTYTMGQVFSPDRISESALNLADKDDLYRSWDVHAERLVACADCHHSLNNPNYDEPSELEHLSYDPRRLDFADYLQRPLHQWAGEGDSEQTCTSCHTATASHSVWLPYVDRHLSVVACETCHVPAIYAPALQTIDWTVVGLDGEPRREYRGVDGALDETALINSFTPVILSDAEGALTPYNLVTKYYWVYGESNVPITASEVSAAWLENGTYAPDILTAFDADASGALDAHELMLDTAAKIDLIAARLAARGFENARIVGDVIPYALHHNVAYGEWATRDCQTCHANDSRIAVPMVLSNRTPNGVTPTFIGGSSPTGTISLSDGVTSFAPDAADRYILGHDSVALIDTLGALMFVGVLFALAVHGGVRYLSARRRVPTQPELRKVYMYSVYERQWHWLQTVVILGMLFTGLIIHKPEIFGAFSFAYVVQVHNVFAAILVINAALAAFYHFTTGEIRQFLPRPYGFFDQAFMQAKFYLRGIFKGEEHPFEKSRDRKMNPLQQLTYLAILNVLLPLQIITGILMWGAQQWQDVAVRLGGLPFLAPFHTLIAWLFASFIVAHVYLTTTGHKPLAGIESMITGWDKIETHQAHSEPKEALS